MSNIQVGDVVQLKIEDHWANDLLMIVEETRDWGVVGFIPTPRGDAPIRANHEHITAIWRRRHDA